MRADFFHFSYKCITRGLCLDKITHIWPYFSRKNLYQSCFLNAPSECFLSPSPLQKLESRRDRKGGGGGSLVKYQLNHSQNSSTSVKLIEKPFITGCLSDMLAVCHLSPECPYYLWHIRCDVFCGSGNKVEPPPLYIHSLHWQVHIISMFHLILSQPLSPPVIHLEKDRWSDVRRLDWQRRC